MGFSLKLMFEILLEILNSKKTDSEKIKEIETALDQAKKYAKECNQLT